ncbi:MAG: prenyltransferase, partial [Bacteroidales bacterium]|nr:prenyltransferase [Bacteroidales bacterium]
TDKSVEKKNLAVLIGNQKINLAIDAIFNFAPVLILVSGVIWAGLSPYYLFTLLITYMPIALFRMMYWFVKNPSKKFEHKKWMGLFQSWENIKKYGLEWYMIRWFLARNYVTFFCIIIIVVSLVV